MPTADIPSFPPQSVVDKAAELGFGSGPWTRNDLEQLWGPNAASRFVNDAKDAGFLVSPFRNAFYVPAAQDLMVVSWLAEPQRTEFVISRALLTAGLKFWCLSDWARRFGLEFPAPLFVTDLSKRRSATAPIKRRETALPPLNEIRRRVQTVAFDFKSLPFLDNLIIVTELPATRPFAVPSRMVVPSPDRPSKRFDDWLRDETYADQPGPPAQERLAPWKPGREIRYSLSPPIDDSAWVAALFSALEVPRLTEKIPEILDQEKKRGDRRAQRGRDSRKPPTGRPQAPFPARMETWAGLMSQPQPNDSWRRVLQGDQFPFLLVPESLWSEVIAAKQTQLYFNLKNLARQGEPGA